MSQAVVFDAAGRPAVPLTHGIALPAGPFAAGSTKTTSGEGNGMPPKKKHIYLADEQEFLDLFQELPPVIARNYVEKYFGGLFTRKTLANHDAQGKGPDVSYAVGKTIVYRKDALLRWILRNYEIKRMETVKDLEA